MYFCFIHLPADRYSRPTAMALLRQRVKGTPKRRVVDRIGGTWTEEGKPALADRGDR